MKSEPQLTTEQIHALIRAAESRFGYNLPIEDFDFLTYAISTFTAQLISKFILGAKEHNDTFLQVNHQQEITKEILDIWNYHAAMNYLATMRLRNLQQPTSQLV